MPSPVVARARTVALVLAAVLALVALVLPLVGWGRPGVPHAAPPVNPAVVVGCLLAAVALTGWALVGRLQDAVTARTRARRPGPVAALTTADLATGAGQTSPGAPVAWQDPVTVLAWRASWRRLAGPAVLAAACAVLLLLTGLMTSMRAADLAERGVRTPGQVTAAGWAFTGLGHSPWARVTHVEQGRTISSTVHGVDPVVLPVGTQLTILVDPDDPETTRALDAPNVSPAAAWWRTLLRLVLAAALLALLVGALRRLAWRTALRRSAGSEWQVDGAPAGRVAALRLVPLDPALVRPEVALPVLATSTEAVEPGRVLVVPCRESDALLVRRSLLLLGGGALHEARLPATPAAHRRVARSLR